MHRANEVVNKACLIILCITITLFIRQLLGGVLISTTKLPALAVIYAQCLSDHYHEAPFITIKLLYFHANLLTTEDVLFGVSSPACEFQYLAPPYAPQYSQEFDWWFDRAIRHRRHPASLG